MWATDSQAWEASHSKPAEKTIPIRTGSFSSLTFKILRGTEIQSTGANSSKKKRGKNESSLYQPLALTVVGSTTYTLCSLGVGGNQSKPRIKCQAVPWVLRSNSALNALWELLSMRPPPPTLNFWVNCIQELFTMSEYSGIYNSTYNCPSLGCYHLAEQRCLRIKIIHLFFLLCY